MSRSSIRLAALFCALVLPAPTLAAACQRPDTPCSMMEDSAQPLCHEVESALTCCASHEGPSPVSATPARGVRVEPFTAPTGGFYRASLPPLEPALPVGVPRADFARAAPPLFTLFAALLI